MGLSDKAQALAVLVSMMFLALGTAAATIPDFVPTDARAWIATIFWILGIVGMALKDALGGQAPPTQASKT